MPRRVAKCAVVFALMLSIGLHWALVQSIAWAGMIVDFSHTSSISEAVSKTFDGKHLCKLCKAIQKGRGEDQSQDQDKIKTNLKLEIGLICDPIIFDFECGNQPVLPSDDSSKLRFSTPPTPPPRPSASFIIA